MYPAVACRCDCIEQADCSIDVAICAAFACINDGGNGVRARSRVVDGDLLVADRIVVGIGASVAGHYEVREGDDGIAFLADNAAGAW